GLGGGRDAGASRPLRAPHGERVLPREARAARPAGPDGDTGPRSHGGAGGVRDDAAPSAARDARHDTRRRTRHDRRGARPLRGGPPRLPRRPGGEMTGTFTASDGVRLAYYVDDFADPWKPSNAIVLLHAAMGSARRFYSMVPRLARH